MVNKAQCRSFSCDESDPTTQSDATDVTQIYLEVYNMAIIRIFAMWLNLMAFLLNRCLRGRIEGLRRASISTFYRVASYLAVMPDTEYIEASDPVSVFDSIGKTSNCSSLLRNTTSLRISF